MRQATASHRHQLKGYPYILATACLSLIAAAGIALGGGSAAHSQATTTIQAGDLWFCDPSFENGICEREVRVGGTVTWQDIDSSPIDIPHTVTQCGTTCDDPAPVTPLFDSRSDPADDGQSGPNNLLLDGGETYSFTFGSPGTYLYRCELHPLQMRGKVTVLAAPVQAPTPTPPPPTPAAVQPNAVPVGGGAPPADGGTPPLWLLAAAGGAVLAASATVLGLRGPRR